jgi:hypothetical protein
MKLNINKTALTLGLTGTLILFAGSMITMNASDIPTGKGGAQFLMKADAPRTTMAAAPMKCTRCIDAYTMKRDLNARGANKPLTLVAEHQCGSCSTRITMAGVGKSKQDVALHSCGSGLAQNLTCCTRNQ